VGKKGQSPKAKGQTPKSGGTGVIARDADDRALNIPARIGQVLGLLCLVVLPLASGGYSGWGYQCGYVLLPLAAVLCLPSLRLGRLALGVIAAFLLSALLLLTPLHASAFAGQALWFNLLALAAAWIVTRSILLEPDDLARWLLPAIAVSAVLTALAGLFPYWGHWLNAGDFDYMVVSTFGLHNAYAGFLLLAWPGAALAALQTRGSARALFWAAALLLLITLVLTASRAATFAMVLQLGVFALAVLRQRLRWGNLATVLAGLVLLGTPVAAGALYLRSHFDYSLLGRLRFWDASLRMALEHPLGVGLGGFRYAYPQYQVDWQYYSVDPHSWPIQLLAELGIPGALLALVIAVGVVRWARRAVAAGSAGSGLTGWLAVVAVGGSLLHAAFDFDYTFAATTAVLGVLLAYGTAPRAKAAESAGPVATEQVNISQRPLRTVAALWLLALCGWGQLLTLERFVLDELRAAQIADPRLSAARRVELLRQAVSLMPRDEAAQLDLAHALAEREGKRSRAAHDHATRAAQLAPHNAAAYALLGALASSPQDADAQFRRALKLDPYNHPEFYFAWASAAQTPEQRYERLKLGVERIPMEAPIQPDHVRYPDWHQFNPIWGKWWSQLAQLETDPAAKRKYAEIAARFGSE
jgi:O-antigen ligase